MKRYKITVLRTAWGHADIHLEAANKKEAREMALDIAGEYDYTEHTSDYKVEHITNLTD